jgi:hypothetical protein
MEAIEVVGVRAVVVHTEVVFVVAAVDDIVVVVL